MHRPKQTSRIQILFRQKWWQIWLPKEVTLVYNTEPIAEMQELVVDLKSLTLDIADRLDKSEARQIEVVHIEEDDFDSLADPDPEYDPIVEAFRADFEEDKPPVKIHIKDEAELEGVTGGDFDPEEASEFAVEFDPENATSWKPKQVGSVVMAEPPIMRKMRNVAREDMRTLQDKNPNQQ